MPQEVLRQHRIVAVLGALYGTWIFFFFAKFIQILHGTGSFFFQNDPQMRPGPCVRDGMVSTINITFLSLFYWVGLG